ncbi:MAG: PAS domain S-box protein, partial [Promethearchaeota archaeon]
MTEHRDSGPESSDQESEYKLIAENVRDLVSVFNENAQLIFINNLVEEIAGFTKEELLSKKPEDYVHPEDLEKSAKFFQEVFQKGEATVELRQRRKDGQYVWLNAKGKRVV